MPIPPRLLIVAGSDSGGGAGIQADIKTATAFQVYAMTAITAVTVQNTLGVHDRSDIPPRIVAGQIEAVAADMGVDAAKTGMLASAEIIEAVAAACEQAGIGGFQAGQHHCRWPCVNAWWGGASVPAPWWRAGAVPIDRLGPSTVELPAQPE